MINIIALDIGGVIAYQDFSRLTNHEKFLLQIYREEIPIARISQQKLITIQDEIDKRIEEIYKKLYVLRNGALDTLEYIVQKNYTPSLWTNNRPAIHEWLRESGIRDYVSSEHICNSCDMPNGINKPNPKFYIHAVKKLSSSPSQILFIDDNQKNIEEAKKLGISCLHYSQEYDLKESIQQKIKILERK